MLLRKSPDETLCFEHAQWIYVIKLMKKEKDRSKWGSNLEPSVFQTQTTRLVPTAAQVECGAPYQVVTIFTPIFVNSTGVILFSKKVLSENVSLANFNLLILLSQIYYFRSFRNYCITWRNIVNLAKLLVYQSEKQFSSCSLIVWCTFTEKF